MLPSNVYLLKIVSSLVYLKEIFFHILATEQKLLVIHISLVVLFSMSMALPNMEIDRTKILADTGVYGTFVLFDVSKEWAIKGMNEKKKGVEEARTVVDAFKGKVLLDSFLTLGLTNESFFLLRLTSYELLNIQNFIADLMTTGLGRYLIIRFTITGVTKKLDYAPKFPELLEQLEASKYEGEPPKYVIVIPTRKDATWWNSPEEDRADMMAEHIEVTLPYLSKVERKLYHATGISVADFITYFETNSLEDFNSLVLIAVGFHKRPLTIHHWEVG